MITLCQSKHTHTHTYTHESAQFFPVLFYFNAELLSNYPTTNAQNMFYRNLFFFETRPWTCYTSTRNYHRTTHAQNMFYRNFLFVFFVDMFYVNAEVVPNYPFTLTYSTGILYYIFLDVFNVNAELLPNFPCTEHFM